MSDDKLARHAQWKRVRPTSGPELHKLLVAHGVPIRALRPSIGATSTAERYQPGSKWEQHQGPLDVDDDWLAALRVKVDGMPMGALAVLGERRYGAGVYGGLDVLDVDPRSGGKESWERLVELGAVPKVLAWQRSASGGWHAFIHPLGRRKVRDLLPGLDYLGGTSAGEGRAFVFITPTLGVSKGPEPAAGQDARYSVDPDLAQVALPSDYNWRGGAEQLLSLVDARRTEKTKPEKAAPVALDVAGGAEVDPRWSGYVREAVGLELERLRELHGTPWDAGHGHDETVYRVACTLLDFADAPWNPWTRAAAERTWRSALDSAYTEDWVATKWSSATSSVSGVGRPVPDFTGYLPLDDGGVLEMGGDGEVDFDFSVEVETSDPTAKFERAVAEAMEKERVRTEARRRIAAENEIGQRFSVLSAQDLDDIPDEPRMRVAGMIPWGAGSLVVARRKAGKTTFVLNLVRSLLTGEKFLGEYDVIPVAAGRKVAFLNYELSPGQMKIWVRDVGLRANPNLLVLNLKGCRNPLVHPQDRAELAAELRDLGVEVLIVDPFRVAAGQIEQNSASEVSQWLASLDDFARAQVGATDVILIAHAGKTGETARGASALEDWPDSIVNVERRDDGERTFAAFGRDVDIDTRSMSFDETTRRLTAGESVEEGRKARARKLSEREASVIQIVRDNPGITTNKIAAKLSILGLGIRTKADLTKLIDIHEERGLLRREPGTNRSTLHFPAGVADALAGQGGLEAFDDVPETPVTDGHGE